MSQPVLAGFQGPVVKSDKDSVILDQATFLLIPQQPVAGGSAWLISDCPLLVPPRHHHSHQPLYKQGLAGLLLWFSRYKVDELHPINFLYLILGFINLVFY